MNNVILVEFKFTTDMKVNSLNKHGEVQKNNNQKKSFQIVWQKCMSLNTFYPINEW